MADESVQDLLMGYVQGKLSPEDRHQVETAAASDRKLAAEIEVLRGIAAAVKSSDDVGWSSELGWARFARQIDAEQPASPARAGNVVFWRAAAAMLGIIAVGQLVYQILPAGQERGAGATYQTASEAAATGPVLRIAFRPDAREADIRAAILAVEGNIVGGPSALGLYDVAFATEAQRDAALASLAPRTDLIESVSTN